MIHFEAVNIYSLSQFILLNVDTVDSFGSSKDRENKKKRVKNKEKIKRLQLKSPCFISWLVTMTMTMIDGQGAWDNLVATMSYFIELRGHVYRNSAIQSEPEWTSFQRIQY